MEWPISETIAGKFLSFCALVKYEWLLQNRWLPLSKEHLFSAVLFGSPLSSVVCMCLTFFILLYIFWELLSRFGGRYGSVGACIHSLSQVSKSISVGYLIERSFKQCSDQLTRQSLNSLTKYICAIDIRFIV